MKVFVVGYTTNSGEYGIDRIFSTEEKAKEYLGDLINNGHYTIDKYEVDYDEGASQ